MRELLNELLRIVPSASKEGEPEEKKLEAFQEFLYRAFSDLKLSLCLHLLGQKWFSREGRKLGIGAENEKNEGLKANFLGKITGHNVSILDFQMTQHQQGLANGVLQSKLVETENEDLLIIHNYCQRKKVFEVYFASTAFKSVPRKVSP